jgi:hypothetical protein
VAFYTILTFILFIARYCYEPGKCFQYRKQCPATHDLRFGYLSGIIRFKLLYSSNLKYNPVHIRHSSSNYQKFTRNTMGSIANDFYPPVIIMKVQGIRGHC